MKFNMPKLLFEFFEETAEGHRKKIGEVRTLSVQGAIIQMRLYPYVWPDDWRDGPHEKPEKVFGLAAMDVFAFYGCRRGYSYIDYGNGVDGKWYRIYEHREDGTILVYPEKEIKDV